MARCGLWPCRTTRSRPSGNFKSFHWATKASASAKHLGQHSASAFTGNFGQRIVNRFGLTEWDDSDISRHGVSLLSGGSGRLDTRLDTPPSIKRRHPDSCIALEFVTVGLCAALIVYAGAPIASHRRAADASAATLSDSVS
jgi:hypothetical protein